MDDTRSNTSNSSNASDDNNKTQQAPVAPVAPKLKEQGPVSASATAGEKDEYWENYSREIELEKQVLEMGGIEKIESGEVAVPEQMAKEMGIRPTVTVQTPIAKTTDFTVSGVSLDDNQLTAGLARPTSSGFRWLVEWFIFQLLKAHFHIKKVKNKITRWKS